MDSMDSIVDYRFSLNAEDSMKEHDYTFLHPNDPESNSKLD